MCVCVCDDDGTCLFIDSGGYVRQDTSDGSFINNYTAILFYGS